jgi:acetyl-CoA carboxylase biotin carboxyl carrier protein
MAALRSTVSGSVIAVLVSVGQRVAIDDDIVLMESMKMEIPVAAESAGVVSEIRVAKGDAVAEGDILVQID